jgi:preprotein translocase subunit SecG
MGFIIVILTVFIVLNCALLILLVLMQLPKKEAGAGLAFGGAATDALFGAGSGNFLTKATKYAAAAFFVLSMLLGILQRNSFLHSSAEFRRSVEQGSQQSQSTAPAAAPASAPAAATAPATTPEAPAPANPRPLISSGTNATAPK